MVIMANGVSYGIMDLDLVEELGLLTFLLTFLGSTGAFSKGSR
jgi:hypothetical protein